MDKNNKQCANERGFTHTHTHTHTNEAALLISLSLARPPPHRFISSHKTSASQINGKLRSFQFTLQANGVCGGGGEVHDIHTCIVL